jgi:hypothetical protein
MDSVVPSRRRRTGTKSHGSELAKKRQAEHGFRESLVVNVIPEAADHKIRPDADCRVRRV